ncbi:glycosyltransferase [Allokutzneria sp. A3M-2-11 16]|uniref:glycosyltransferase n=1 Tax=Allokutzneria sp. A3M-2-11 16 TaxID=2962043 RepID=UPI0020B6CBB2|nr:glycosyltransferase [Allokutzneria sp. A3M-2-11 16]MCP3801116.1 glycosyltransferase [Allokutzneria sp. A3M-2-11 16]
MKICFVTTYPLGRRELGGSGWVDRRLLAMLSRSHDVDVVCVTGDEGNWSDEGLPCHSAGSVPLEVRGDRARLLRVAAGMLTSPEPYLARKFTVFPGWRRAAALLRERAAGREVITSGWPGLLLAEAAGVPVASHVAHNVESTIAVEHSPRPLRLLGETWRLPRAERRLLALPDKVFTLSRTDAYVLRGWGIGAEHLPLPLIPQPVSSSTEALGFIGKASWPPNERALAALVGPVRAELDRLGQDVPYVLAGNGTESYAGHRAVTALGRVKEEADFYRKVGLVVVPRFGASTGISVKMLEAAEYGLPSVVPPQLAAAVDPRGPWLIADGPAATASAIASWRSGESTVDVASWLARHNVTTTPTPLLPQSS